MAGQQFPANQSDDMAPPATTSSFSNFQFTFNCSAGSSGQNSFIEPDPDAEDLSATFPNSQIAIDTGINHQSSDSESLTDSIQNYPEEFGRTYHAYRAGSYAFPNDFVERERLDYQSLAMAKLFSGRLYYAPLSKRHPPLHILDIATGTGDWAIRMGDEFPNAEIIATDLSPIQPQDVPPNVNFFVEDSSQEWDYSHPFDYIHTRVTAGCWSSFQTQIAQQAFDSLVPGGYFESQELEVAVGCDDGTINPDGALARWFNKLQVSSAMLDRPLAMAHTLKGVYEAVGFVDVQQRMYKMPINGWPKDERLKELGRMWERNLLEGLSGFCLHLFNRAFGETPEQIEVNLVDVRREINDTRIHAYQPIFVVTGRKPFHEGTL